MNTIKEQWDSFEKEVVPAGASEIQVQEMRRSFYGGVMAMSLIQDVIGQEAMSEDAAMGILQGVEQELRDFLNSITKGEA